ncbi:MAG: hypothetical protein P1V20_09190 [Verrucomicrobiales bacterium]|nr:hypothetical protein [Verrucomicrobiales bacterium]
MEENIEPNKNGTAEESESKETTQSHAEIHKAGHFFCNVLSSRQIGKRDVKGLGSSKPIATFLQVQLLLDKKPEIAIGTHHTIVFPGTNPVPITFSRVVPTPRGFVTEAEIG